MNTFLFTGRYLPFPHPTSKPMAPSGRSFRNCSTIGHGWARDQQLDLRKKKIPTAGDSHLESRRGEMRRNVFVDFVHVLRLIVGAANLAFCHGEFQVISRGNKSYYLAGFKWSRKSSIADWWEVPTLWGSVGASANRGSQDRTLCRRHTFISSQPEHSNI